MVRHVYKLGVPKLKEREQAIELRHQGLAYSEILKQVPVAKSTLSVWLGGVGLTTKQKQRLTMRRHEAQMRGAAARRKQRVDVSADIFSNAKSKVGNVSRRELWLVGAALYWAEGSKQHEHTPSVGIQFSNSDPAMIRLFLAWLRDVDVLDEALVFELYIHQERADEIARFKAWWARELGVSAQRLSRVYLKRGNPKTNRKNRGDLYHGLLRIKVKRSTNLNRTITGIIQGIVQNVK